MSNFVAEVIALYGEYGFKCERKHETKGILVFTLQNGYFDNAEIISLNAADQFEKDVFADYSRSGYACTSRKIDSLVQIESDLFKGFFLVDSTKDRLRLDYAKFTKSITSIFSENATYDYIDVPYYLNDRQVDQGIMQVISDRLDDPAPTLFLIEAAAGFGKTCTAYELVNEMLSRENKLPLFSELSRNRSAKIFRYVLLDEIDRTFPQLKSRLVESEILKGRVVVVLDGFDELLRKTGDGGEFENTEPMLETIGELLKGKAKIILTTRRTVIFEGDDFHKWAEAHADHFSILKFRLNEPAVEDWLPDERRRSLNSSGFKIDSLANPVLLSYLRCISDLEFAEAANDRDGLVAKYFTSMLERERLRQDLRLDADGQYLVLKQIAHDMIALGYTSESREYIVDLIKDKQLKVLDEIRASYASSEKPSRDEIANKLASHALLDKSSSDDSKIGFVNEFVFGNFVAENIIADENWLNDDLRFLEPAVISYVPRSEQQRFKLQAAIGDVMEFLDWTSRIIFSLKLGGIIDFELTSGEADSVTFESVNVGNTRIKEFQFNDCAFHSCQFSKGILFDVTFLNCKFYDCTVLINAEVGGEVHVLGCQGDAEFLAELSNFSAQTVELEVSTEVNHRAVEKFILEKFWPIGSLNFHRRRPIKGICVRNNMYAPEELYEGIARLKKRGLLFEPYKHSFLELAVPNIAEIRQVLNRPI